MALVTDQMIVEIQADLKSFNAALQGIDGRLANFERRAQRSFNNVNRSLQNLDRGFARLRVAVGAVFGSIVLREFFTAIDTMQRMEARLKLVTATTGELVGIQSRLFEIAQRTRAEFETTVRLYSRMAFATRQFGISQERLLNVTELVNKAITISGSNTAEASNAITQFTQAIQSNTLRGDELRSILEQLPGLALNLAAGLGVTIGELREMGEQGELTANKVIFALEEMQGQIESQFGRLPRTIGQAFVQLQNQALVTFGGIGDQVIGEGLAKSMDELREILASPEFKQGLAVILGAVVDIVAAMAAAVAEGAKFKKSVEELETPAPFGNLIPDLTWILDLFRDGEDDVKQFAIVNDDLSDALWAQRGQYRFLADAVDQYNDSIGEKDKKTRKTLEQLKAEEIGLMLLVEAYKHGTAAVKAQEAANEAAQIVAANGEKITPARIKMMREMIERINALKNQIKELAGAQDELNKFNEEAAKLERILKQQADDRNRDYEETIENLQQQYLDYTNLNEALKINENAVDRINDEMDANVIISRLKLRADSAEAEQIRELIILINGQKRAYDSAREAKRESARESERLRKEMEKEAEDRQKEIDRIVGRATDSIVEESERIFEHILSRSKSTWRDIAEDMLATMRRAFAKLAAEAIIRPIVAPIVAGALGGSSAVGGGGGGLLGGIGQNIGSSLISKGLGLDKIGASISTSLFGGFGAGGFAAGNIGSIGASAAATPGLLAGLGVGGPLLLAGGLAAATILGSGLLNKEQGPPAGGARIGVRPDGSLYVKATGTDNGGDASQAIAAAQDLISKLSTFTSLTGASIDVRNAPGYNNINLGIGTLDGSFSRSADDVFRSLLEGGAFQGLSAQLETVALEEGLDEALRGAAFIKQFSDAIEQLNDPLAFAIKQINIQFDSFEADAEKFGVDMNDINRLRAQAIEDAREQFATAAQDIFFGFDNIEDLKTARNRANRAIGVRRRRLNGNELGALLLEFDLQAEAEIAARKKLGQDIGILEKLLADERLALIKDFNDRAAEEERRARDQRLRDLENAERDLQGARQSAYDFFQGLIGPLKQFQFGVGLGSLTGLSPGEQLASARAEFGRVRAGALAGNVRDIERLPEVGQALLEVSRLNNASGPAFARDFQTVTQTVDRVIATAQNLQEQNFSDLADSISITIQAQTRDLRNAIESLEAEVRRLRTQV